MKVIKKQNNSHDCLVCGVDNPLGVKASFYEMEDKSLIALFSFKSHHQSYPERTHGGMISSLIDETIGRAMWIYQPDGWACTLKLEVQFHKAVPYDVPLKCIAKIDKIDKISFHGTADILTRDNVLLARGSALYMFLTLATISPTKGQDIHPQDINVFVPDGIKEID